MLKKVISHLRLRRTWNRTRRYRWPRATCRALTTVYITGPVWRRI